MKMTTWKMLVWGMLFLMLTICGMGNDIDRVEKTFGAAKLVTIKTISGDLELKAGPEGRIHVLLSQNHSEGELEPIMEMRGDILELAEKLPKGNSTGQSKWTVTLPPDSEVKFVSASGGCRAEGMKVNLSVHNASGNIDLSRMEGRFDIKTASGDLDGAGLKGMVTYSGASGNIKLTDMDGTLHIRGASSDFWGSRLVGTVQVSLASGEVLIRDSQGTFAVKTASGDLSVRNVAVRGNSDFKSASGNVLLRLDGPLSGQVSLKSASGMVTLQQVAQTPDIEFICTMGKDKGRILAPFDFATEREFEQYGQTYVEKVIKFGKGGNRVTMSSSSGVLTIEK
jgi:DUF4097 and DUF4098 domain-containing protein YvlB